MVSFSDRVAVPGNVLVRHLSGETVLLNIETEKYFGLDTTATLMWQFATTSPTVENAYVRLSEEFDVAPEILRAHLLDLLRELADNGLVKIMPADVESIPAV